MARCPYCDAELPGLERICRDCWEKGRANVTPLRASDWAPGVALVALIVLAIWLLPPAVESFLNRLSMFVLSLTLAVKGSLAVVAGGVAVADSWRWKSWWRLITWACCLFAVVGLVHWAGTLQRAWEIFSLGALGLSVVSRAMAKAKDVWQD
jgi:hypothetical protein